MFIFRIRYLTRLLLAVSLTCGLPARAVTVDCGPNVCFEYDETQAAVALFGLPTRVGDAMQFLPESFLALSADGAGTVTVSSTFVFSRIYTVAGGEIDSIYVNEEGDYEVIGAGSVSATLGLTVENNFNAGAESTATSSVFSQVGDSGGPDIWEVSAARWPAAAFVDTSKDLRVSIENILEAVTSASGQYAFIQKKFVMETQWLPLPEVVVPVPAAAWLLGSSLAVLGMVRRKTSPARPPE